MLLEAFQCDPLHGVGHKYPCQQVLAFRADPQLWRNLVVDCQDAL
jgi:hypothetical protein